MHRGYIFYGGGSIYILSAYTLNVNGRDLSSVHHQRRHHRSFMLKSHVDRYFQS